MDLMKHAKDFLHRSISHHKQTRTQYSGQLNRRGLRMMDSEEPLKTKAYSPQMGS
jgi:hypothetical protein